MTAPPMTLPPPPAAAALAAAAAPLPPHAPLAAVLRGGMIDAVHSGSVAVVDLGGRLLHAAGNPWSVVPTRSTLKPFQAVPLVAAGGVERFGFTSAEVALLCASHSGEERHVAAAAGLLGKAGNRVEDLQCGSHVPYRYEATGAPPPPPPWSPLAHNCSGKHSGMLAWCVHCGAPKESYLDFDHPLQAAIRRSVAHFTGVAEVRSRLGCRRLLGAELRGAAGGSRTGLRPVGRHCRRPGLRRRPGAAVRGDDDTPRDGLRRRAQRPRVHARRSRRLGRQGRRRRTAGDRYPEPGIGHRDQGRRRRRARLASGDGRGARPAGAARRRAARGTRGLAGTGGAQHAAASLPGRFGRWLSWTSCRP